MFWTWTRRDFLRVTTAGTVGATVGGVRALGLESLAAASLPARRRGAANRFTRNGKPLLVVVEGSEPEGMLQAGLEALGGLESLVKGADAVILKPNMLKPQPYPVTSDPDLVFALSRHLNSIGCKHIIVRDSPSAAGAKKDAPFSQNGYFQRGESAGIDVVATDKQSDSDFVPCSDDRWQLHPEVLVDRGLIEADVIINLPTLKRHFIPGMTCAMKNFFGGVHGRERMKAHRAARSGAEGVRTFRQTIAQFADAFRAELTIVDARSLLVKGGPSLGGGPAEVKTGVNRMILGGDLVAVDAYAANLMQEQDDTFSAAMADDTLAHAESLGLGVGDVRRVEIVEVSAS